MQLRYLAPLVFALLVGIAWSVRGYLEADHQLRTDLRLQQAEVPPQIPAGELLDPTARLLLPAGSQSSS
jgi:hypothetical protein